MAERQKQKGRISSDQQAEGAGGDVGVCMRACVCTSKGLQSQIQSVDLIAWVNQDGVVSPTVNAGVSWQASIQIDSDSGTRCNDQV